MTGQELCQVFLCDPLRPKPNEKKVYTVGAAHNIFDWRRKLVTLPLSSMTNATVRRTARLEIPNKPCKACKWSSTILNNNTDLIKNTLKTSFQSLAPSLCSFITLTASWWWWHFIRELLSGGPRMGTGWSSLTMVSENTACHSCPRATAKSLISMPPEHPLL